MLLAAFEVNNFFPFRETLFHRGASRFLQSRGAFMLLFASRVNRFFRFREISFRLRFREPFSFVARSVYAPPLFQSQQLFPSQCQLSLYSFSLLALGKLATYDIYGLIDFGRLDKQQLLPTMRDFAVRRGWDACAAWGFASSAGEGM